MNNNHFPLATGNLFPLMTTVLQLFDEKLPQYDSPWIFSEASKLKLTREEKAAGLDGPELALGFHDRPNRSRETGSEVRTFASLQEYEGFVRTRLKDMKRDLNRRRWQEIKNSKNCWTTLAEQLRLNTVSNRTEAESEILELLKQWLASLSQQDRDIILDPIVDGKKDKDIGTKWAMSQSAVSTRRNKLLNEFRDWLDLKTRRGE